MLSQSAPGLLRAVAECTQPHAALFGAADRSLQVRGEGVYCARACRRSGTSCQLVVCDARSDRE
jgi:hypothetical protein